MKNSFKKVFPLIGIVAGVLVVVFGILFVAGVFGDGVNRAIINSGSYYENGYAKFGTDFYTYLVNNTYATAEAVQTVSQNQVALSKMMGTCVGSILIAFGIFMAVFFGIGFSKIKEEDSAKLASEKMINDEKKNVRVVVTGEDLPDIE